MAAIIGTFRPSKRAHSSRYSASLGGPENSLMSAPVKKLLPAQRRIDARARRCRRRPASSASRMPARAAAVIVLTGGLSTTMTAMSPWRCSSTMGLI